MKAKNFTLKDLAVNHDYYASDSNYYSNAASHNYEDWDGFVSEWGLADVDMNLCYRWDIRQNDDNSYSMQVTIIGQRKGKYIPCTINSIEDKDVPGILKYLHKHHKTMKQIWSPLA